MTQTYWKYGGIIIALIGAGAVLAFGVSDFIPFWKTFIVVSYLKLLGFGIYHFRKSSQIKTKSSNDEVFAEYETVIAEQVEVITEYEKIFDSQLVELPCICGGNTFQGLFSPKLENIVECEKCRNKYRVNVQYDSVLISEPLSPNETFETMIGDINN